MKPQAETLLKDVLSLPEADRAEIAGALLQSLEPPADPSIEDAWRAEVSRRLADFDAGGAETVPWEQVRDQLYSRLNARRSG